MKKIEGEKTYTNVTDIIEEITQVSPEIIRYLDHRLDQWADWNLEKDRHKLDYSSTSMEYRIMTLGCVPPEKPGPKPLPTNESAEEMEAIICIMAKQNKVSERCATALREYYLGHGRRKQERAARCMGISERNFRQCFKDAYVWLAGWFTCEYAGNLLKRLVLEANG